LEARPDTGPIAASLCATARLPPRLPWSRRVGGCRYGRRHPPAGLGL